MKNTDVALTTPAPSSAALPDLDIRFPAGYAWLLMGIGAVFFLLGLLIAFVFRHGSLGFGLFLMALSAAAVIGGNYWRQHLHVVAQLTSRQLILRREGAVNWDEIAAIETKEIHSSYRGTKGKSEFVCLKLKSPRAPQSGLQGFMARAKAAITGYDIIVPMSEFSCNADWFVTECRKRIAAVPGLNPK